MATTTLAQTQTVLHECNMNRIADLTVHVNNIGKLHMANWYATHTLGHLLRVSLDYHNKNKEKQCTSKLDAVDKHLTRVIGFSNFLEKHRKEAAVPAISIPLKSTVYNLRRIVQPQFEA